MAFIARARGGEVHLLGRSEESVAFAYGVGFESVWTYETLPALAWDAVVDASNSPDVPAQAVDLVEPGGRVVLIGLAGTPSLVDTRSIALKDATAVGILSGSGAIAETVATFAAGEFDARNLVATTIGLDDVASVLAGETPAGMGRGAQDPRRAKQRGNGLMGEFDGLVAVVTGGSSGIGAAAARLLGERGASVAVLDLAPDAAAPSTLAIACDVADRASVDAAIAQTIKRLGRLDIVINNAGIGAAGDVTANDDAEWQHVLNVNVIGMGRVARAAVPHLRQSPSAAIVNTSSAVAVVGVPNRALYSASKGAIAALTLAMAADHVREGIRVNAVLPGTADTPWVARILAAADDPAKTAEALRARQPIGRLVSADEVANAICYLASPLSGSTTGSLLVVDGGMSSLRLPAQ